MTTPPHQPDPGTEKPADGTATVSLARERLESHPHLHHHCETIQIEWIDGRLVLSGRLPSFHLKQLVQEALRVLKLPILNQIDVSCPTGLDNSRDGPSPENAIWQKPR